LPHRTLERASRTRLRHRPGNILRRITTLGADRTFLPRCHLYFIFGIIGATGLYFGKLSLIQPGGIDIFGGRDLRILVIGGYRRLAFESIRIGLAFLINFGGAQHQALGLSSAITRRCRRGISRWRRCVHIGRRHGDNAIRHRLGFVFQWIIGGADFERGLHQGRCAFCRSRHL
jgi:hypothetical protein